MPAVETEPQGLLMVTLHKLPAAELQAMAAAGETVLEVHRVLAKSGSNVVAEILRGQGVFYELKSYPEGDVYDPDSHSQYFYHSHRKGEHGHFHTFLREPGMPQGCHPVPQSRVAVMKERTDKISHLVAISMNREGLPIRLFTTNRWLTGENWYRASDVVTMLERFEIDLSWPSWPVNMWITSMLRLFRPVIAELLFERDASIERLKKRHPRKDVFEDRGCDITSQRSISPFDYIKKLGEALQFRTAGTARL